MPTLALSNRGLLNPTQDEKMIVKVKADIKKIFKLGKKYKWQKPARCHHCKEPTLWGHGFVLSFFYGFDQGLYLKRYRCPYCHTIFKLKPYGYFNKFQADIFKHPKPDIQRQIPARIVVESSALLVHRLKTQHSRLFVQHMEQRGDCRFC